MNKAFKCAEFSLAYGKCFLKYFFRTEQKLEVVKNIEKGESIECIKKVFP